MICYYVWRCIGFHIPCSHVSVVGWCELLFVLSRLPECICCAYVSRVLRIIHQSVFGTTIHVCFPTRLCTKREYDLISPRRCHRQKRQTYTVGGVFGNHIFKNHLYVCVCVCLYVCACVSCLSQVFLYVCMRMCLLSTNVRQHVDRMLTNCWWQCDEMTKRWRISHWLSTKCPRQDDERLTTFKKTTVRCFY